MELKVCIGSACHLKGSYEVLNKLKELIEADGLSNQINLKASFCLGHCGNDVTVSRDGVFLDGVNPETVESVYLEKIKAVL